MNRRWVWLTLAFALVVLVVLGAVAILIRQTAETEFRQYITHSGMMASGSRMEELIAYYDSQGGWDGVEIAVSDTGEGIAPEDLPHIFDRFWRADPARARGDRWNDSSGLGLSVAQSLVEAKGGESGPVVSQDRAAPSASHCLFSPSPNHAYLTSSKLHDIILFNYFV